MKKFFAYFINTDAEQNLFHANNDANFTAPSKYITHTRYFG